MKYIFAGGGTGGHIFPAIAIADELRKLDKNAEILFIGAKGRIEEKIVPANNYELKTLDIKGIDRKVFYKNFFLPVKLIKAVIDSGKIIKDFKPDTVIGTGGFVCGPVVYAAGKVGIPTLIQEGNSFAGRTIKYLSLRSDKVIINFEETSDYLKRKDNILRIPHPIRSSLKKSERDQALKEFELDADRKTIFIFGGSQGARGINEGVETMLVRLYEKGYNIIWQTGVNDYNQLKKKFAEYAGRVKIFEFILDMAKVYSASDLIICRAGITSIMEIAYFGLPAIFIPLPGSAEDHQYRNAESLVKRNSAVLIKQDEIKTKLYDKIIELTENDILIKELRKNISELSDADAAKRIAVEVIKLTGNNERKNI